MFTKRLFYFIICSLLIACNGEKDSSMDYILDMVHNNPGEEPFVTKYNDPKYLKEQGYNGTVGVWHINCAINYDSFVKDIIPQNSEERKWIDKKAKLIAQKIDSCEKYGINVYPFTDFIVFPESIWKAYEDEIVADGQLNNLGGKISQNRKPNLQSELLQQLVVAQIDEIFTKFPKLDGLTLRFGETYLHDTPFHSGGSPIRKGEEGIEDHIKLINILKEEVCVKRNKKLFYRTWDFGHNFHTNPSYYLQVTNEIVPHQNLIFSIKYQQGDFHRMTPFNPCIGIGKHQQIVESQSRLEAYGKGAHPYYTAKAVIEGWPETEYEIDFRKNAFAENRPLNSKPRGLKNVLDSGTLNGTMTWSHGGGWKGPYIKHEIWTDLNSYVVSQWAQDPNKPEEEIFSQFASKLGLEGEALDKFRRLCLLTIDGVGKGHINSYWRNSVWWTRDQYFSAAQNRNIAREIVENGLMEQVLKEKSESAETWRDIEKLSRQIEVNDSIAQQAIETSCTYGRIKYELIEQMWIMMLKVNLPDSKSRNNQLKASIIRYDELWEEWYLLEKTHPLCASIYTDMAFKDERGGSIGEFVDQLREQLNDN
ncbi:MAG: hypothetical protein AAFX87_05455 [Bacteroidota bacterium]